MTVEGWQKQTETRNTRIAEPHEAEVKGQKSKERERSW